MTEYICPRRKASHAPRLMTASQRRDLAEAIRLVRGIDSITYDIPKLGKGKGKDVTEVTKLPGYSPMQLRAELSKIAKIRQEYELIRKQYEETLKQLSDLEKQEAEGIKKLKEAAEKMGQTGKFVAETEEALLEWTAFTQEKRPGIEQMIARADDPEVIKKGLNAGDLFGRIAEKLGNEIAQTVAEIYKNCAEDLTHTAYALRGLKVVIKTKEQNPAVVKKAGLMDVVVGVKDWLAGKANAAAKAILHFSGSITDWVKGYDRRERAVEKSYLNLRKALAEARKETDKLLKAA